MPRSALLPLLLLSLASCAHNALATAPPVAHHADAALDGPSLSVPDAAPALATGCPVASASAALVLARVAEDTVTGCDLALGELARTSDGEPPATPRALFERALADALFAREARARGLDRLPDVRRRLDATLAAALLRSLAREGAPDTVDLEQYYSAHLAEFTEPERAHLRALAVDTRAQAVALLAEAQAPDARVPQLARERSTLASLRRDSGDLGLLPAGGNDRVPEPVARAGFALTTVGSWHPEPLDVTTSEPQGRRHRLRPVHRFWIVQLVDRVPARTRPFAELEPLLRRRLSHTVFAGARARHREALEALVTAGMSRVHIDEAALRSVRLNLPPEPAAPPPRARRR